MSATRDWFYNFPPMAAGDALLHVTPISHGAGYLYLPTWCAGGINVLVDHFDAGETLEIFERERIAYVLAVPTMLNLMVRHPDARTRDFSALKVLQIGGAPVQERTAELAYEIFGKVLYQQYGQTEALPATMMLPEEWFGDLTDKKRLQAAGRPFPFAIVEIRDPDDPMRKLPQGEEGEIAVHKDGQMTGYWNDPEATARKLTADGFVLSGDVGRFDEDGFLYVLDRTDDMIVSGGFNIWPLELENVILTHPDVIEVAVFAAPHEKWGETPVAVCYRNGRRDDDLMISEILALCLARLGSYKKPTTIILQDEPLPRSAVGKISRKTLREPYWVNHSRRIAG